MKLLLALLFSFQVSYGTSLFGALKAPDGTGMTGTLYLTLSKQGALQTTGSCGGPAEILPGVQKVIVVLAGTMQGGPVVYGNDCMLPQGTYYNAQFKDRNGNLLMNDNWLITGATLDVGTIVSVTVTGTTTTLGAPGVVFTLPTGNQTVVQPASTALGVNYFTVTGTFTAPNGATCTVSGCSGFIPGGGTIMTTDTSQTVTGPKNFLTDIAFSGASVGTPTFPAVNGLFGGAVLTPVAKIFSGTVSAQTDYFSWAQPFIHAVSLYNSTGNESLRVDQANTANPTLPATPGTQFYSWWEFYGSLIPIGAGDPTHPKNIGSAAFPWDSAYFSAAVVANGGISTAAGSNSQVYVGTGGNFYNKPFSGGDAVCTGVDDVWTAVRTDTHELQFCIGGSLFKLTL